jgi:uncharacterized protein YndB with AHSA1/START domain
MPDILHRVGIRSSRDEVYRALTTREGLASWWTKETQGEGEAGGELRFRFGQKGSFDIRVLEARTAEHVLWEVVGGPEEWIGTRIRFDLREEDDHAIVLFRHQGWREPVEFMHHCSTKWGVFLMSLKSLLEDGAGAPHPDDVKIDNWN